MSPTCLPCGQHQAKQPQEEPIPASNPKPTSSTTYRQAVQLSPQRLQPCSAPRQLQHCWAGGQRPGAGGSQRQRRRQRLVVAWAEGWRVCLRCACHSVCCSHTFSPLFCRQSWLWCCLLASAGVAGTAATAAATRHAANAADQGLNGSLQLIRCCKCCQHSSGQPLPARDVDARQGQGG